MQHTGLASQGHGSRPGVHVEVAVDRQGLQAHRGLAEADARGDLPIRQPLGHALQDEHLPRSEISGRRPFRHEVPTRRRARKPFSTGLRLTGEE